MLALKQFIKNINKQLFYDKQVLDKRYFLITRKYIPEESLGKSRLEFLNFPDAPFEFEITPTPTNLILRVQSIEPIKPTVSQRFPT